MTDWPCFSIGDTGADELNDTFGDSLKKSKILSASFVANKVLAAFLISGKCFPLSQ